MSERLIIATGDVIEVQLTSETYHFAADEARGRRRRRRRSAPPSGKILNRMRVFIREPDGKERNYDFEDARLGVHDGHKVCIVRGKCAGEKTPVNLMLCNLSTEDREVFEGQVLRFLDRPRLFGPAWKALGLTLIFWALATIFWTLIVTEGRNMLTVGIYALFFSFLVYPVMWGITALWDRVTQSQRFKAGRARLIADVERRIAAGAPSPQTA